MAIANDATGTGQTTGTTATTLTDSSLTIGSSGNALVGAISFLGVPTGLTASWNSNSMTLIGSKVASDNSSSCWIFGLLKGALGTGFTGNHSLVYNWTGSLLYSEVASSYTGVDQGSFATSFPSANVVTDASSPAGNYPSFSITTLSGDAAYVGVSAAGDFWSGIITGTLLYVDGGNNGIFGFNLAVGSSTQVVFGPLAGGGSSPATAVGFRMVATGNVAGAKGGTLMLMGVG